MSAVPVSPDKEARLARRLADLNIRESDITEKFVRSGGHGGQNVNKTSTCVMLLHRPTGLQVKCQTSRHQALNRFLARCLLLQKIEARRRLEADAARALREKISRQKRKPSRAARERTLADKSHHSLKKADRRRISIE